MEQQKGSSTTMATQASSSKNFIDFMSDAEDEELLKSFIDTKSIDDLKTFFMNNNYVIDPTDLEKIWDLKQKRGLDSWPPPPHY